MLRQFELVEKVLAYNPDADEALLNKAYVYAMTKHGSQRRASGDPYISHPIEVAGILADMRLDEATIAVALLHDTIEDTDATREDIETGFGEEISSLVEALTKLKKLDLVTKRAQQAENLRRFCWPPPKTFVYFWSSSPTGFIICARSTMCHPISASEFLKRPWSSTRRWRAAWACRICARSWRIYVSAISTPQLTPQCLRG